MKQDKNPSSVHPSVDSLAAAGDSAIDWWNRNDRGSRSVEAVPGEAPSLLPEGLDFCLVWNDEFNGDHLDDTKWGYRTNFWGQRAHWFATPEDNAVEIRDGKLFLKLARRADGQIVSPQHQTGELVWDHPWNPEGGCVHRRLCPRIRHRSIGGRRRRHP